MTGHTFDLLCCTIAIKGIRPLRSPSFWLGYRINQPSLIQGSSSCLYVILMFMGMEYSVTLFRSLVGASSSIHFHEAVQIFWHWLNSSLKSGWLMQSAAHIGTSRNCAVPACVMRTLPSALIASYLSSKSKPSMSFRNTNTLFLADSLESVQILTDPTPQYACVSPFMVILMLVLLQMWPNFMLTMVQEQPESRSAKQGQHLLTVIFLLFSSSFSHFLHFRPSVSLFGQTASSLICQSFFSIYSGQSLPIRALKNIMPELIERGGAKEWMLSSPPISHLFLVQFQVSLTDNAWHIPYPFLWWVSMMAATVVSCPVAEKLCKYIQTKLI